MIAAIYARKSDWIGLDASSSGSMRATRAVARLARIWPLVNGYCSAPTR